MASMLSSELRDDSEVQWSSSKNGARRGLGLALFAGATILATPLTASAQHPIGIELVTQLPPFDGEAEWDDVEVSYNGNTYDVRGDDDEDIEDNFGIAGYYLFELSPGLGLGPRGMFLGGEGDDSNIDYNTFDAGVMLRYTFDTPKVLPFVQGGLGLTFAEADHHDNINGLGWHLSAGGGCGFPVSDRVALFAGMIFHRQAARLKGDVDVGGGVNGDLEADVVLTRVLTTFGVGF